MKSKIYTPRVLSKIRALGEQGWTQYGAAVKLKLSVDQIRVACHHHGVTAFKERRKQKTRAILTDILGLYSRGIPVPEIAGRLCKSPGQIYNYISQYNITSPEHKNRGTTDKEIAYLKKLVDKDFQCKQIAVKMSIKFKRQVSIGNVLSWCYKNGFSLEKKWHEGHMKNEKVRGKNRYTLKEDNNK
jgi:transposase